MSFAKINAIAILALVLGASADHGHRPRFTPGPLSGRPFSIDFDNYPNKHGAIAFGAQQATSPSTSQHAPAPTITRRPGSRRLQARIDQGDLTIQFVNSHTADVSTAHAQNYNGPGPDSGNVGPGVLGVGQWDGFAVPTGYGGNVAIVENGSGRQIVGQESLFETSFVQQYGSSNAYIDIDVSYVAGFSVPIVCSCDNLGVVAGCNKYLWDINICPNDNGVGSCVNPQAGNNDPNAQPDPFWAPCQHAAFTVPQDPGANINNICQSGIVTCCIGAACPGNPNYQ